MNMRNCGGTESLSPTLYHSGLSGDVRAVAEFFAALHNLSHIAWVGYSMGGNMVLKAAGECGNTAPHWLRAAVGVSPVLDLQPSADALHNPRNRIYEWNFLRNMLARYRRKAELLPGKFSLANCKLVRSIRTYDEYIVAPNCGFLGADDYYDRAASARVIDRIAVPTLILHALDDPFIRILPRHAKRLTPIQTSHSSKQSAAAIVHFSRRRRRNTMATGRNPPCRALSNPPSHPQRDETSMHADWTVACAADDPWVVVPWSREDETICYIDLRAAPQRLEEITEAVQYPCLAKALRRWNQPDTSLFTAKCDVWNYPARLFDAEDLPASITHAAVTSTFSPSSQNCSRVLPPVNNNCGRGRKSHDPFRCRPPDVSGPCAEHASCLR